MGATWRRRVPRVAMLVGALLMGPIPPTGARAAEAAVQPSVDSVALPLTGLSEMVVDDAHAHLFLSGFSFLSGFNGTSDSAVVVMNTDGTIEKTFTGVAGAAGMYLDSTANMLYVAENEGDAVQQIHTDTLTLGTEYTLGTDADCPYDVVKAAGYVWTNIGCGANAGGLARINPATSLVTSYPAAGGGWLLETYGNLVFTATMHSSPSGIIKYDVTGGTPTFGATTGGVADSLADIAMAPDGSDIITAADYPYHLGAYAVSDLSLDAQYPTGPGPVAVTVSADSSWVVGAAVGVTPDVLVFPSGTTTPTNDFPSTEIGGVVAPRGLAMSADNASLFTVTGIGPYGAGSPVLNVISDPTVPRSTLSLTPVTQTVRITTAATLSGTLTFTDGSSAAGQTVHVVRTDPDASQTPLPDATTGLSGGFTVLDTPPQIGTASYDVTFDGTAGHRPGSASALVTAAKQATILTLKTSKSAVNYGSAVGVTAKLNRFDPGQVVSIYVTPYGGSKHLLTSGPVNGLGILTVSYKPSKKATFSASSIEGPTYLSANSGTVTVLVHPLFAGKMIGGYATKNGYRLYHFTKTCPGSHKGCPITAFALAPNHAGKTVDCVLQLHTPRGWVTAGSFRGKLSSKSTLVVLWFYNNSNVIGIHTRVRATFGGDKDHTSATSSYLYFVVTH